MATYVPSPLVGVLSSAAVGRVDPRVGVTSNERSSVYSFQESFDVIPESSDKQLDAERDCSPNTEEAVKESNTIPEQENASPPQEETPESANSATGGARSDATSAAGETSDSPVQGSCVTVRTGRSRRNGVSSKTDWNITQHRRQLSQSANQESGAAARLGDRREGVCEASEGACNQFRVEARVLGKRL